LQKYAREKSVELLLNSELYNSIIETILNYQTNFRITPEPDLTFIVDGKEKNFYKFFKIFRKMYLVYGFIALYKLSEKKYEFISPAILKPYKPFVEVGGVKKLTLIDKRTIDVEDLIIIKNNPIPGIDLWLPEFYSILPDIDLIDNLDYSNLYKRTILANIALFLFGSNPENIVTDLESVRNQLDEYLTGLKEKIKITKGSIVLAPPEHKFEVVKPITNEDDEDVYKRICKIAASVNIPAFLLTGDLKELNYAASRSALQDFVVFCNRKIEEFVYLLQEDLPISGMITLPPPTTISTAETIKYFEWFYGLTNDPEMNLSKLEMKTKMKIGGML